MLTIHIHFLILPGMLLNKSHIPSKSFKLPPQQVRLKWTMIISNDFSSEAVIWFL